MLITLNTAIVQPWRLVGVVFAATPLGFALASFWPRRFDVLDNMRYYLAAQPEQTELVLVDTLGLMNAHMDRAMGKKAQRVKLALLTLAIAAVFLGVGVVLRPGGVHA